MDNIVSTASPRVTTGPLPSSQKIYVTPQAAPDLSVPLREIELSSPSEPRVRVYDTTGPYTDPAVTIDVRQGLARARRAWVLARCRFPTRRARCVALPASRSPSSNGRAQA